MARNSQTNEVKSTNENETNNNNKKCFVMMPFSDSIDYEPNHFTKVYEQIITPAIQKAGYEPVRIDQNKISDQIIKKIFDEITEADMAICDLSTNNPNVLYELGLRHAFDKPVVLIRDNKTPNIFDIQGISIVPYRSERLYDEVLEDVNQISSAIKANSSNKSGYSIVTLVKLSKATYNDEEIDNSKDGINTALLYQISAMLSSMQKQNNNFMYNSNSTSAEHFLDKTTSKINELSDFINASYQGTVDLNREMIEAELLRTKNAILDYSCSDNIPDTYRNRCKALVMRINRLISRLDNMNTEAKTCNT